MFTIMALAKLNLTLEVLARRADGYHEIRSVFQTINLCDRLTFESADEMQFLCDTPGWQADHSLVYRAAHLIRQSSGYGGGASIHLTKHIPFSSGLGGDSSAAAAVLRGLNQLWKLEMPLGDLVQMAARLGSDVPYFLSGGTALVQGRGEIVSPLPALPGMWVVLLHPPVARPENKTAGLYQRLKLEYFSDGGYTDELVTLLTRGGDVASMRFYNVFEKVAYAAFGGLERYRDQFLKAGADSVHLAGSGPALFAIFNDRARADRIYDSLKLSGLEAYLVDTLDAIEGGR
jgi:4-diphosphocytidyl-2-C-methyl-D-erythritol kinase